MLSGYNAGSLIFPNSLQPEQNEKSYNEISFRTTNNAKRAWELHGKMNVGTPPGPKVWESMPHKGHECALSTTLDLWITTNPCIIWLVWEKQRVVQYTVLCVYWILNTVHASCKKKSSLLLQYEKSSPWQRVYLHCWTDRAKSGLGYPHRWHKYKKILKNALTFFKHSNPYHLCFFIFICLYNSHNHNDWNLTTIPAEKQTNVKKKTNQNNNLWHFLYFYY